MGECAQHCIECGTSFPSSTVIPSTTEEAEDDAELEEIFGGRCTDAHHLFLAIRARFCLHCGVQIGD